MIFLSEGFRNRCSSSFSIESLEKCTCIEINYNVLDYIINTDNRLKDILNQYYVKEVKNLEYRLRNLAMMNAK